MCVEAVLFSIYVMLLQIPKGGWFAVAIAGGVAVFSYVWYLGTSFKRQFAADHQASC